MKRKILVTTGTRADYGLLRPVLHAIRKSKKLQLYLIVTGMHVSKKYGLTVNEIKKDGFKIYKKIPMLPKEDTSYDMTKTLGKGIILFSKIFHEIKPDINVILGDRDEMLASALAASHMNILNAHIHGGDKSGGLDEYNRHAITKISNIHFAATKKSKERIIKMGENPKYVFFTGSPSIDEVFQHKMTSKIQLEKKYKLNFSQDVILLVQHPVTTQPEDSKKQILAILEGLSRINKQTIAIAPNSDAGNAMIFKYLKIFSNKYDFLKVYPSIPRSDYLGLLNNCVLLIGNSSSGLIEASYFDIPVVNVGMRQNDRERGKNVFDVKNESSKLIYNTVLKAIKFGKNKKFFKENIYGEGNAAEKIVIRLERINLNKKLIQKQILY